MRIEFEFSGGYGGLFTARPLGYNVETDALPEPEREKLLALIDGSGLLEEEAGPGPGAPGPQRDVFAYKLSIGDGGRTRSFSFDDVSAPPAVRPLLNFLRELAVERRMRP